MILDTILFTADLRDREICFCFTLQIAAATDLAVRYNDQSVLENHHIAIALSIITTDAFSILEGLSAPNFDHVRRVLIETILATDMARHGDITAQFAKVH